MILIEFKQLLEEDKVQINAIQKGNTGLEKQRYFSKSCIINTQSGNYIRDSDHGFCGKSIIPDWKMIEWSAANQRKSHTEIQGTYLEDYFQVTHIDIPEETMVQIRQRGFETEEYYDKKYHNIKKKICQEIGRPKNVLVNYCNECKNTPYNCDCVF